MKTFKTSASNTLSVAAEILFTVEEKLATLKENEYFNVLAYAKQLEEDGVCDELFAATLIRSTVKACTQYKSKRGPGGGVGWAPKVEEKQDTTAAEPPQTVTEVPVSTEESASSEAELADTLKQQDVSVADAEQPANNVSAEAEEFLNDHFAFVSVG